MNTHEGIEKNGSRALAERRILRPRTDVHETESAWIVTCDVPGVDRSALEVTLERDVLRIRAAARLDPLQGYETELAEFELGEYERDFLLSDEIDRAGIAAAVANGVLRVTLPKARPKNSRIEVASA